VLAVPGVAPPGDARQESEMMAIPPPVVGPATLTAAPAAWDTVRAVAGYLADNPPAAEEAQEWTDSAIWVLGQVRRHSAGGASL
jgi:hypothetical protein